MQGSAYLIPNLHFIHMKLQILFTFTFMSDVLIYRMLQITVTLTHNLNYYIFVFFILYCYWFI